MAFTTKGNFWDSRASDGRDRSHVPGQPMFIAFIRIAQLVLALLLLILTAYSASKLGSGAAGFGLTWFSFILTVGLIVYLGVSIITAPHVYNPWAHLALESLCVIFWLCSWAVLASYAAAWGDFDGYYGFGYYYSYGRDWKSAIDCIKASAALGALLWVLFSVTLGFFIMSILSHRRTHAGTGAGVHTETKPVGGPAVGAGAAAGTTGGAPYEMAPMQQQQHTQPAVYPTQQTGYEQQNYQQQAPATYPPQEQQQTYQQGPYVEGGHQQPAATYEQQQPQVPGATHHQQGQAPYPQ